MSDCPSFDGPVCSLCCAPDARYGDQCHPQAHLVAQPSALISRILPWHLYQRLHSVSGRFLGIFTITSGIIAALLMLVFYAQRDKSQPELALISGTLWQVFFLLLLITGVLIWLHLLAQKSARFALEETLFQAGLLSKEVKAYKASAIELAKARDAAVAANQAKSRYLSGVSHELRTPLNTIFGYSQLMEADSRLDDKSRKIASVMRRSSEHLSDVIEGLLEISRIEARKLDLHRDTFDLRSLIQQLEDMFLPLAQARGIDFVVNIQSNLASFVSADEKRLRQILLNLVSNAIKFTPTGTVELNISYRNQVARLTVRDTGIGIAAGDLEKIFKPFERLHHSQTQNISGTGLGLSISRLLVEIMGGDLYVKSKPGIGSEFCLSLFLPSVSVDRAIPRSKNTISAYTGQARHIFVVDDETRHRKLIADLLHPLGFIVHTAESAEQALTRLKEHPVDLFLLDIRMPGVDGWQLLKILRIQGFTTPIIMLSADPYEDVNLNRKNADFQAYINKPLRLEKLKEQLQRCLDLEWRNSLAPIHNKEKPGEIDCIPHEESLATLRDYAKIGYLKGVFECTEKIETQHPHIHLVDKLRTMADLCDLDGIVRLIDQLQAQTESC
ncbi:MAG: ATP-binding protein [Gammaproteobacteria bacterium]